MGSSNEDDDEDSTTVNEFRKFMRNSLDDLTELGTKLKLKSYKIKVKLDNSDDANIGEITLYLAQYLKLLKINVDGFVLCLLKNVGNLNKNVHIEKLKETLAILNELKEFCHCPSIINAGDDELNITNNNPEPKPPDINVENKVPEMGKNARKSNLSLAKTDTQNTDDSWEDTLSRSGIVSDLGDPSTVKCKKVENATPADKTIVNTTINNVESQNEKGEQCDDKLSQGSESSGTIIMSPPSPRTLRMMYIEQPDSNDPSSDNEYSSTAKQNVADTIGDSSDLTKDDTAIEQGNEQGADEDSSERQNDSVEDHEISNSDSAVQDSAIESDNCSMSENHAIRECDEILTEDTAGETLEFAEELPHDDEVTGDVQNENLEAIDKNAERAAKNDTDSKSRSEEAESTGKNNDALNGCSAETVKNNLEGDGNQNNRNSGTLDSQGSGTSSASMTLREIEDLVAKEIAKELDDINSKESGNNNETSHVDEHNKGLEKQNETLDTSEKPKTNEELSDAVPGNDKQVSSDLSEFEEFAKELDSVLSQPLQPSLEKDRDRNTNLIGSEELSELNKELEELLNKDAENRTKNYNETSSKIRTSSETETDSLATTQLTCIDDNDGNKDSGSCQNNDDDCQSESSFVFDIHHIEDVQEEGGRSEPINSQMAKTVIAGSETDKMDDLGDVFSDTAINHSSRADTDSDESNITIKEEIQTRELVVLVEDINTKRETEQEEDRKDVLTQVKDEFSHVIDSYMKEKIDGAVVNSLSSQDKDELLKLLEDHIHTRNSDPESEEIHESQDDVFSETHGKMDMTMTSNRDLLEALLDDYFRCQEAQKNSEQENNNCSDASVESAFKLLHVTREEVILDTQASKRGRKKSDATLADEILKAWMEEDKEDDVNTETESLIHSSEIDIEVSDLDSSSESEVEDKEPDHAPGTDSDDCQTAIIRDCRVVLERYHDHGAAFTKTLQRKRRKTSSTTTSDSDIDRLCDLSNLDQHRQVLTRSARKRLRLKSCARRRGRSSSSSSSLSSLSGSAVDWSDDDGRRRDPDDLGVAPLEQDNEDDEERMALAMLDLIRDSSAVEDGYDSWSEAERKKRRDVKAEELLPRRRKRKRSKWEYDSLLRGKLSSDESDASAKSSTVSSDDKLTKKPKTLSDHDQDSGTAGDSDTTVINEIVIKDEVITPKKELLFNLIDNSLSDSDIEFVIDKHRTPKKIHSCQEEDNRNEDSEEDEESKKGKGRRNIRGLLTDEKLAESTQIANREEEERIARLEEKRKIAESFSQPMSSSQFSEDDKLVLDFDKETSEPLVTVHAKLSKRLKPHQRDGVEFMWDSCYESVARLKEDKGSGCILAHCMGLGKTYQALTLVHTLFSHEVTNTKHVLVVCPLSTVSNWKKEFEIAFRKIRKCDINLFTLGDKTSSSAKADIVKKWRRKTGMLVMGYEAFGILTNEQKLDKLVSPRKKDGCVEALISPGPDLVICDEGHLLKNKQTQRTLALNKIATKRRIVLTGTPLQNNLNEYYHMVHFVKPNLLGTEKEFKTNFVNPISNGQYEDSTYEDIRLMKKRTHILHRVLENTVQRVEDNELERYLPKRIDYAVFIQLSPVQVEMYNKYMQGAEGLRDGVLNNKCFLNDVQIIKYICTHPHILNIAEKLAYKKLKEKDVIDENEKDVSKVEKCSITKGFWKDLQPKDIKAVIDYGHKLKVVRHIIEECEAVDDKVLIFSQSLAEMDCIEHFLQTCGTARCNSWKTRVDYFRMDGTIPPEERTRMCSRFNDKTNKRIRVFLMSAKVGGLGLNLTAANRVIIMTVNWNPSYDTQSVFRAYRFGQDKTVYIYRLIAFDTMEEKIYQRQVTKLAIAHRVVDRHQITRHYSSMDLEELYSLRPKLNKERPLPMVPEDKLLAKLIQRLPCVFKWHEHSALLTNRPEEDLNDEEKKDAWDEFTRREKEPPPQTLPVPVNSNTLPQHPQMQLAAAGNLVLPSTSNHSFNISAINPTFQRTDSLNNFNMQFRPATYSLISNQQTTTSVGHNVTASGQKVTAIGHNTTTTNLLDLTTTQNTTGSTQNVPVTSQYTAVGQKVPPLNQIGIPTATTSQSTNRKVMAIQYPSVNGTNATTGSNAAGLQNPFFKRHIVPVPGLVQNLTQKINELGKSYNIGGKVADKPSSHGALAKRQEPSTNAKNSRKSPNTIHSYIVRKTPPNSQLSQDGASAKSLSPKPIDLTKPKVIISHNKVKVPSPLPDASIHSYRPPVRVIKPSPPDSRLKKNLVFSNGANSNKENKSLTGRNEPQASWKNDLVRSMYERFRGHVNLVDDELEVVSDTTNGSEAGSLSSEIIKNLTQNGVSINKVIEADSSDKVITLD